MRERERKLLTEKRERESFPQRQTRGAAKKQRLAYGKSSTRRRESRESFFQRRTRDADVLEDGRAPRRKLESTKLERGEDGTAIGAKTVVGLNWSGDVELIGVGESRSDLENC